MEYFQNVIYWLSNGLLVPVFIAVGYYLIRGIVLIITLYVLYIERLKVKKAYQLHLDTKNVDKMTKTLHRNNKFLLESRNLLVVYTNKLLDTIGEEELTMKIVDGSAVREKIVADFVVACQCDLDKSRTLSKLGPMLGLMGTLIPMGPALGGLAAGDIAEMSSHLQIAFNTTVMGLVIGAIGYTTLQVKQRWYASDINIIEFLCSSIEHNIRKNVNQSNDFVDKNSNSINQSSNFVEASSETQEK